MCRVHRPLRQWAIEHQIQVGRYLDARDFVPVAQAHVMADTKSLGATGVEWLEAWSTLPREQRRDCQDFRVRAMTMGRKEPSHGTTQNPGDR